MARIALSLVLLAVAALSARADFPFDPDGAGPRPTIQVGAFDFLVGNSLAKGALAGETWTLYYQASLASLTDKDTLPIPDTGLNVDHEITVVAGITVKTTKVGMMLNFALVPGNSNFVRIYHDDKVDANPLAGTGYANGKLILESHTTDDLQGTLIIMNFPSALDRFGSNNDWPGVMSLRGLGALQASSVVSSFDTAFFQLPQGAIERIDINSSQAAPFDQMQPSKQFWNGTGFFAPAIGATNLKTGPDGLLQADANASFRIKP